MIEKYTPWILVFCLATGWFTDRNASEIIAQKRNDEMNTTETKKSTKDQTKEKVWEAFEISDLINKRQESKRPYLPFLNRNTLSLGVYSLPKDSEDKQPVHDEDEVYYIENGKATLRIGEEDRPVKKGSVIFVKRGVSHKFHSIEQDLDVLVFFSSSKAID